MKTYIDKRGWQYAVRPALGNDIEADLARWAAKKHMRCMEG